MARSPRHRAVRVRRRDQRRRDGAARGPGGPHEDGRDGRRGGTTDRADLDVDPLGQVLARGHRLGGLGARPNRATGRRGSLQNASLRLAKALAAQQATSRKHSDSGNKEQGRHVHASFRGKAHAVPLATMAREVSSTTCCSDARRDRTSRPSRGAFSTVRPVSSRGAPRLRASSGSGRESARSVGARRWSPTA
jgi:hypothetical protein